MIADQGYERTTLRGLAEATGVSPGLLYRYFPNKQAIGLALYDELSLDFASAASQMKAGSWRTRSAFALETSMRTLGPYRDTLSEMTGLLLGNETQGILSPATAFSRDRVQAIFVEAVSGAKDAPATKTAQSLGRLLYLAHLGVLLWWLLDKSPNQSATTLLVALIKRASPALAVGLRLPATRRWVRSLDEAAGRALFASPSP